MDEISVLDYLKFRLNPKNIGKEILPEENPYAAAIDTEDGAAVVKRQPGPLETALESAFSGKSFSGIRLDGVFVMIAVIFAVIAQVILEPTIFTRTDMIPWFGAGFYLLSAASLFISFVMHKKNFGKQEAAANEKTFDNRIDGVWLIVSTVFLIAAFLLFGGNRFNFLNVAVWLIALLSALIAFSGRSLQEIASGFLAKVKTMVSRENILTVRFSWWNLLCILAFALCAFFMFYRLDSVPANMVSDHAEKLYDIRDLLDGTTSIFFSRNTGRECFQFYFTALIIKIFGTGLTFLSLKIGAALAGLFMLPFIYKIGKLTGNRWVGLFAMLFAGTSYWAVVIARAALRFIYFPMFAAPALYFLLKGLKERSRASLIGCGIFLGIGLHGYSPFRIVPIVCAVIFLIWLFMDCGREERGNALNAFLALIFFAFIVFLPLARVMVDMPDAVLYRSITRLGTLEKSYDGSPLLIFLNNVWQGIVMPFWKDGSSWVHCIVYRPALEHLTGSFFFLGLIFLLLRFISKRNWMDLCLILSVPLLMLPSTLSLAFPAENPCLNRTAGALVPVMVIAAYGFCCSFDWIARMLKKSLIAFGALSVVSLIIVLNVLTGNFDLIFKQYAYEYERASWNTPQIGEVIKGFAESVGSYDEAYVIPYPYWVDTRNCGIEAGDPYKDYSYDRSMLSAIPDDGRPRLFIYRDCDTETRDEIRRLFPNGVEQLHTGAYDGKDFYSYITIGGKAVN